MPNTSGKVKMWSDVDSKKRGSVDKIPTPTPFKACYYIDLNGFFMKIKKYVPITIQSRQLKIAKTHKQQYLYKDCRRQFVTKTHLRVSYKITPNFLKKNSLTIIHQLSAGEMSIREWCGDFSRKNIY